MEKKTIADIDVKGKRVLVRCDFNVPQDENGNITDDNRIKGALPTIQSLVKGGGKVILCSHLGRPKGTFNAKYSLKPVAVRLSELLGIPVVLATDVIGDDAKAKAAALKDGDVMLLENVRFHKEEEKNDPEFSKALAQFADVYVNDAFGTAHRAHSSTAGVSEFCKINVCGMLIEKEISVMGGALNDPKRPFWAILGGAKVSDKIGVINNLIDKVDGIIIGGAMAYTFLVAQGGQVGKSRVELDKVDLAKELMKKAEQKGIKLVLPVDTVIADEFSPTANSKVVPSNAIPSDWEGLDIGPKSCELFASYIKDARTIIWNGPMGVFEFEKFAVGTKCVAQSLSDNKNAITIIGGGDSAAAIEQLGYADKVTHISTGGGASLEYLEGKVLPGIDCLDNLK